MYQQEQSNFLKANDVMKILGVAQTKAYKIIKQLNKELEEKGYITLSGKVSKKYFFEKYYGES